MADRALQAVGIATRNAALEEAAKVAEQNDKDPYARQVWQGVEIAAAIRKLKT